MKRIKIVPTVEVEGIDGKKEAFPMSKWLETAIKATKLFGQGFSNIATGMKLMKAIETQMVEGAEHLKIEDADFAKLKDAVNMCEWNPNVAFQIFDYFKAVEEAEDCNE